MDLLILIVLVSVALVPIVLVCGFAGCSSFSSAASAPPNPPSNLQAVTQGTDRIRLSWQDNSAGTAKFVIRRGKVPDPLGDLPGEIAGITVDDQSLDPSTTYAYSVKATVPGSGLYSAESNTVTATTLALPAPPPPPSWQTAYGVPLTIDGADFRNDCLVQRISKAQLALGGTRVKLTMRASSVATLAIDRLFISQAAEPGVAGNPTPDAWDSAVDLMEVRPGGVALPPGVAIALDPFNYTVDTSKDLIVAMNISAAAGVSRKATVPGSTLYVKPNVREAAQANRTTAYQPTPNSVYLVETLEVWTGPLPPSPPAPVWQNAYTVPLTTDGTDFRGDTLIQRIDKAHLSSSGNSVRLTIHGASNAPIVVNRLFISQAAEPSGANPTPSFWDSALDLKEVRPGGLSLPANGVVTLDPFDYVLDKNKDLIVAFNVNGTAGAVRRAAVVGPRLFFKAGIQEAQVADRAAGYTTIADTVFLIEKIEVA
jgi:hypothetical protein